MIPYEAIFPLEKELVFDANCSEDEYVWNSSPIYFYSIELKAPLAFMEQGELFFDDRVIDYNYCTGLIANSDLPDTESGKEMKLELKVADFNYRCSIPTYAFRSLKFIRFNLNFKDPSKSCNITYFGNNGSETMFNIDGNYSTISYKRKRCDQEHTQWLEIVQTEGEGGYPEDWLAHSNTLNGKFNAFNGKYSAALNGKDSIAFELKDSTELLLQVYHKEAVTRVEKGSWVYHKDQNTIEIFFKNRILFTQNSDTLNLAHFALLPNEKNTSNLSLSTYRIQAGKVKPFELVKLNHHAR
ncbi:MAG: hypothetical protein AB8G15_08855 [Saprospiraceae bacterium]